MRKQHITWKPLGHYHGYTPVMKHTQLHHQTSTQRRAVEAEERLQCLRLESVQDPTNRSSADTIQESTITVACVVTGAIILFKPDSVTNRSVHQKTGNYVEKRIKRQLLQSFALLVLWTLFTVFFCVYLDLADDQCEWQSCSEHQEKSWKWKLYLKWSENEGITKAGDQILPGCGSSVAKKRAFRPSYGKYPKIQQIFFFVNRKSLEASV